MGALRDIPSLFSGADFTAQADLYYLDQVLSEFTAMGLKSSTILGALVVLAAVALLVALYYYLQAQKAKARAKRPPVGWVTEQRTILDLMDLALQKRSKFEVSFSTDGDDRRRTVHCGFSDYTPERLTLELPAGVQPGRHWVGRELDCFFRLGYRSHGKQRSVFYHFQSVILDVSAGERSIATIKAAFPEHLELSQKRQFMRIAPPSTDVLYLALLPENPTGLRLALRWFSPITREAPKLGNVHEMFQLEDISGEGMKCLVRMKHRKHIETYQFAQGRNYYVLLELAPVPPATEPERFLVLSVVRYHFHDQAAGHTELGMQFMAECTEISGEDGKPVWKMVRKLAQNDIEHWVVQKYLQVFREQGVETDV